MLRKLGSEEGSLYLEALVGITLFSMALLAISPLYVLAMKGNASSENMTISAMLAHEKLEELKAMRYDDLTGGTYTDTRAFDAITFDRSWTIQDNTPHAGMKTISVTASPSVPGNSGPSAQITVSVYLAASE